MADSSKFDLEQKLKKMDRRLHPLFESGIMKKEGGDWVPDREFILGNFLIVNGVLSEVERNAGDIYAVSPESGQLRSFFSNTYRELVEKLNKTVFVRDAVSQERHFQAEGLVNNFSKEELACLPYLVEREAREGEPLFWELSRFFDEQYQSVGIPLARVE